MTLYLAQLGTASEPPDIARTRSQALTIGVIIALMSLLGLFYVFQLDTLLSLIGQTIHALIVNTIVVMSIASISIYSGIRVIRHAHTPRSAIPKPSHARPELFLSIGFVRTCISASGITATFLAATFITDVPHILPRLVLYIYFICTGALPFIAIIYLARAHPERISKLRSRLQTRANLPQTRLVIGYAMVACGVGILIYRLLTLMHI
jgi:hypothetical protein